MPPILTFFVSGIPAPGGSKQGFPIKKGGIYTGRVAIVDAGGQKTKDWRSAVSRMARDAMKLNDLSLFDGPLILCADFYMPRPKYHYGKHGLKEDAPEYHIKSPDATKLLRSTEDSMTGIVYKDDSQIAEQHVVKRYGEKTGCMIRIEAI